MPKRKRVDPHKQAIAQGWINRQTGEITTRGENEMERRRDPDKDRELDDPRQPHGWSPNPFPGGNTV